MLNQAVRHGAVFQGKLLPELTELLPFSAHGETVPVVPDSFLDGSATRLRKFSLSDIQFPGSPNLLLSATHLVSLRLFNIPHSGYILTRSDRRSSLRVVHP